MLDGAVGSATNGGAFDVGRSTSLCVASVTPTTAPAAATAAAPTTSQTRTRGVISGDGSQGAHRYISESDADVQGIAAAGARRDLGDRRVACARTDRCEQAGCHRCSRT